MLLFLNKCKPIKIRSLINIANKALVIFYLLIFSITLKLDANSNREQTILSNHGLHNAQGREIYLNNILTPFANKANALRNEIQQLSTHLPKENPPQMDEEFTHKMNCLVEMLPILENISYIDVDFAQLNTISTKQDPLDESEKEVLKRISDLCTFVDTHH